MRRLHREGSWPRTYLFCGGVVNGGYEAADLIAHCLRGDASGSRFEINVAGAANACVEGVAAGHQRARHVEVVDVNGRGCGCRDELRG